MLLLDYCEELRRTNLGTTCIIKTKAVGGDQVRFKRIYACFGALKRGLQLGYKPLIGLDGCHLKFHQYGILLVAIGIDPNNQMYPITYAVVEQEKKKSWAWFLQLLKHDLCIDNNHAWTFMSDKQKTSFV